MVVRFAVVLALIGLAIWGIVTPGKNSAIVVGVLGAALVLFPIVMREALLWSLMPQIRGMEKSLRETLVFWERAQVEPILMLPPSVSEQFAGVATELARQGFSHDSSMRVRRLVDALEPCVYVFEVYKHREEPTIAVVYGQEPQRGDVAKPPSIALCSRSPKERFVITELTATKSPIPAPGSFDRLRIAHSAGLAAAMRLHRFRSRRVHKDMLWLDVWYRGGPATVADFGAADAANLRKIGWLGEPTADGRMRLTDRGARQMARGLVLALLPAVKKRFEMQGEAFRKRFGGADSSV